MNASQEMGSEEAMEPEDEMEPERDGEPEQEPEPKSEWRPDCNPFLLLEGTKWDAPDKFYAVLDQGEFIEDGDRRGLVHLVFSAISQNWFDNELLPEDADGRASYHRRAEIFLIETYMSSATVFRLVAGAVAPGPDDGKPDDGSPEGLDEALERLEGQWKLLVLGGSGLAARRYDNLFGEPNETYLTSAEDAPADAQDRLDETDPLDEENDASQADIELALDPARQIDHVVVYDVGQGGANGLVSNGLVAGYFDFGGGVGSHKSTFPSKLTNFCFCTPDRPIILSHWDHDHWSSEGRDAQSHFTTWIAPRQTGAKSTSNGKLGFHHRALVSSIKKNGKLLLWPGAVASIGVGQATIWKCKGTSRNASGLALVVEPPAGVTPPPGDTLAPALFMGDAGYGDLLPAPGLNFQEIAVPHHGGRSNSPSVPAPPKAYARLMYSYGAGNSYGHAFVSVRDDHYAVGWIDQNSSPPQTPNLVLNTENKTGSVTKHIGFNWSGSFTTGACKCGAQLGVSQS